jgi:protein-disulfide isomerase
MRVNLVVFSSFECPGCREFVSIIHQLVSQFPDKLTVVFKPFPLDPACNPLLSGETDSLACEAAWAAYAAHQQGQFWPYHDALFASNLNEEENVFIRIAMDIGLELDRFEIDRWSPSIQAKVSEDIEMGIRLNIDSTPAVFLNGRRVRNLSLRSLAFLIEKEIEWKNKNLP